MTKLTKQGFTLVELAIVLVIVGLLISGILVAQSMISTVRVDKVVKEVQQYNAAVNLFKDTFKAYPGDWTQAYQHIGTNCGGAAANSVNGNGDGQIRDIPGLVNEQNIGVCELDVFNFVKDSAYYHPANNSYNFRSQYNDKSFFYLAGSSACDTGDDARDSCLYLWNPDNGYGAILPADAAGVDTKLDDGLAPSGNVRSGRTIYVSIPDADNCGDFVPGRNYASNYHYNSKLHSCVMQFKLIDSY